MIQLHDSVLLLSESPCFSNGLRHVRNYRAENFGDISMQRHLVVEFPLERLIEKCTFYSFSVDLLQECFQDGDVKIKIVPTKQSPRGKIAACFSTRTIEMLRKGCCKRTTESPRNRVLQHRHVISIYIRSLWPIPLVTLFFGISRSEGRGQGMRYKLCFLRALTASFLPFKRFGQNS